MPDDSGCQYVLRPLYDQFHDRVEFLSLYVREAHPGQRGAAAIATGLLAIGLVGWVGWNLLKSQKP